MLRDEAPDCARTGSVPPYMGAVPRDRERRSDGAGLNLSGGKVWMLTTAAFSPLAFRLDDSVPVEAGDGFRRGEVAAVAVWFSLEVELASKVKASDEVVDRTVRSSLDVELANEVKASDTVDDRAVEIGVDETESSDEVDGRVVEIGLDELVRGKWRNEMVVGIGVVMAVVARPSPFCRRSRPVFSRRQDSVSNPDLGLASRRQDPLTFDRTSVPRSHHGEGGCYRRRPQTPAAEPGRRQSSPGHANTRSSPTVHLLPRDDRTGGTTTGGTDQTVMGNVSGNDRRERHMTDRHHVR